MSVLWEKRDDKDEPQWDSFDTWCVRMFVLGAWWAAGWFFAEVLL